MFIFKKSETKDNQPRPAVSVVPLVGAVPATDASTSVPAETTLPETQEASGATPSTVGQQGGGGGDRDGDHGGDRPTRSGEFARPRGGSELRRRAPTPQLASTELRQSILFPNRIPLPVIPVPIQILDEMPLPYVHMLFIMLKYVCGCNLL